MLISPLWEKIILPQILAPQAVSFILDKSAGTLNTAMFFSAFVYAIGSRCTLCLGASFRMWGWSPHLLSCNIYNRVACLLSHLDPVLKLVSTQRATRCICGHFDKRPHQEPSEKFR